MPNYTIQVAEEPTEEPVTVQELYDHLSLNIALADVQDLLAVYITAARTQFEADTDGRICCPTVFTQHMSGFPCDPNAPVKLYRGDVLTVDEITYYDEDDAEQTWTDFVTDLTGIPALVCAGDGGYPATSAKRPRTVTVEFTAGYVDADYVPILVRQAILMAAGHYYAVRESHTDINYVDTPLGYKNIVAKYRTGLGGI